MNILGGLDMLGDLGALLGDFDGDLGDLGDLLGDFDGDPFTEYIPARLVLLNLLLVIYIIVNIKLVLKSLDS